jgi:type 1 fimbriae regulatory protein FimB/type 1 fimbriae regulatory protein FimE
VQDSEKPVHPTNSSKTRTLPPRRKKNIELRSREYLTPDEVNQIITAAGSIGRTPHRDRTLLLVCYRHALRVSELVALRWEQVDLSNKTLHVNRAKRGVSSLHPLQDDVISALEAIKHMNNDSQYIYLNYKGIQMSSCTVRKIVARAGKLAGLPFSIHPHMLRHACGFYLANKGFDTRAIQSYMGHRSIQHTVRYTELTTERFRNFWID